MPSELIGQGDVVKGHYTSNERREQIKRYLSDGKIRSTSEIAKALKMQNTTNLRKLLKDMYARFEILAYVESRMYRWQSPVLFQLTLPIGKEQDL